MVRRTTYGGAEWHGQCRGNGQHDSGCDQFRPGGRWAPRTSSPLQVEEATAVMRLWRSAALSIAVQPSGIARLRLSPYREQCVAEPVRWRLKPALARLRCSFCPRTRGLADGEALTLIGDGGRNAERFNSEREPAPRRRPTFSITTAVAFPATAVGQSSASLAVQSGIPVEHRRPDR